MDVQYESPEVLSLAPYNPREEDGVTEDLRKSIEQFGLVLPLIVNSRTNHVVGGNQRLKVARELGMEEVPVVYVDVPETEEKQINVSLNKIDFGWDYGQLSEELQKIKDYEDIDEEFMAEVTGFGNEEIDQIIDQYSVETPEFDPQEPSSGTGNNDGATESQGETTTSESTGSSEPVEADEEFEQNSESVGELVIETTQEQREQITDVLEQVATEEGLANQGEAASFVAEWFLHDTTDET